MTHCQMSKSMLKKLENMKRSMKKEDVMVQLDLLEVIRLRIFLYRPILMIYNRQVDFIIEG